jgi:hypothetical protein
VRDWQPDRAQELYIVTNLPEDVSGLVIAELYRDRWNLETAFQHLATSLRGEVNTLGYPQAALFGFIAIGGMHLPTGRSRRWPTFSSLWPRKHVSLGF